MARHLIAALAWRRAAYRLPWRHEPWTLWEHFGITAGLTAIAVAPYMLAVA